MLARVLYQMSPFLPTPQDILDLWNLSPLSRAFNSTFDTLLITSGEWSRQSETFFELTEESSNFTEVYDISPGNDFHWVKRASEWIFKTTDFSEICRDEETTTPAPTTTPTTITTPDHSSHGPTTPS